MRLQRVLFGYYKERIKGSNLEQHRKKWCLIVVGGVVAFGFGSFFLPISYKVREKIEEGVFDDSPEWKAKKAHINLWFDGQPDLIVKTRAQHDQTVERDIANEFHDV